MSEVSVLQATKAHPIINLLVLKTPFGSDFDMICLHRTTQQSEGLDSS